MTELLETGVSQTTHRPIQQHPSTQKPVRQQYGQTWVFSPSQRLVAQYQHSQQQVVWGCIIVSIIFRCILTISNFSTCVN